jgi:enterochelin esterase-like enzyme
VAPKLKTAHASSAAAPASSERAPARLPAEELTWVWESSPIGKMIAVVVLPERGPGDRFPVLITMHGRGEALKGPERGARGWVDDYALGRALRRLADPPLVPLDFEGHVTADRLEILNQALAAKAYRGLIVVCPYTPDMLAGDAPFERAPPLAAFLAGTLLPRVFKETPALGTRESTGIDGVSLGGRAALTSGLLRPDAFGTVAGIQPAFDRKDAAEITARTRAARQRYPDLRLRLLTSEGDFFLRSTRAIDAALTSASVEHDLLVVPGPHDYEFNRGPGAIEMLFFHDRALRGDAAL